MPMRRRTPRWSVRTRIVAAVMTLTVLALTVVGLAFYTVQKNDIGDRINQQLGREMEEFATEAVSAYESGQFSTLDALLRDVLSHRVPEDSEGMIGYVGLRPAWTQPGGLDMVADADLMIQLGERVEAVTASQSSELGTLTTPESTYRYALMPITLDDLGTGAYALAYDYEAEQAQLVDTFRVFVIAAVICLAVLAVLSWLIAGELLKPVRELQKTASKISESDLDARIEVETHDDLGEMASTFNSMLDRIQGTFASQLQLLDDAGHELRTPITIIRGHLELMDSHDSADVEAVRDLSINELDRMHRLADDLVLLAKAERPDFVSLHPVDSGPFIDRLLTLVQGVGSHAWEIESRVEDIIVMDEQRMTQAMLQLAANAAKFSPAGSTIRLGVAVDGEARLWVADAGIGIAPDKVDLIFERFGRADSTVDGAGLGLPIVAAIASAHGGRVDVSSRPGRGSTFTIVIPHEGESWQTF